MTVATAAIDNKCNNKQQFTDNDCKSNSNKKEQQAIYSNATRNKNNPTELQQQTRTNRVTATTGMQNNIVCK